VPVNRIEEEPEARVSLVEDISRFISMCRGFILGSIIMLSLIVLVTTTGYDDGEHIMLPTGIIGGNYTFDFHIDNISHLYQVVKGGIKVFPRITIDHVVLAHGLFRVILPNEKAVLLTFDKVIPKDFNGPARLFAFPLIHIYNISYSLCLSTGIFDPVR
jgi:hypothetical protein